MTLTSPSGGIRHTGDCRGQTVPFALLRGPQSAALPHEADEKRGGTRSGSRLWSSTAQLRHCL